MAREGEVSTREVSLAQGGELPLRPTLEHLRAALDNHYLFLLILIPLR